MPKTVEPSFQQVSHNKSCFHAKIDTGKKLSNAWHYHPEIELILIKGSRGTRIVGNSVELFDNHDLVLIGENTPHAFLHDEECRQYSSRERHAMIIQFNENFLGHDFLKLPALTEVREVLIKSRQGLSITEWGKQEVIPLFEKVFRSSAFDGIILLLEILKKISSAASHRVLVSNKINHRLNSILDYTCQNYDEHISIGDVARVANLSRESFCRYFKAQINKTYIEFLSEYRINRACEMIRNGQKSIKEIGFSCGFDSLSNFYYQFKKIIKVSPLEYSRMHIYSAKNQKKT
ncbi:MAG: helix-turn-helix domain-containing protein [Chitinophagaceae bacterium]|nr:helix-turn-helix domain-containing protein [Chitinophagaceae bacterium]